MQKEIEKRKLKVKIIIVGEPGAGKSFIARATDACLPTREIGASIGKVMETFENLSCDMTLITWAITRGRPKESTHLKHSGAAIIVCDLTRPETVDLTPDWANRILEIDGDIPMFFAANNAEAADPKALRRFMRVARGFESPCYLIKSTERGTVRALFRAIAKKLSENIMIRKLPDFEEDYSLVSW